MTDKLELVRQNMGGVGERHRWDIERMEALAETAWHPDIVYEEAPEWPGSGTFRGREAILKRFREYMEVMGDAEIEIEELLEVSTDQVLLVFRHIGRGSGSGVPVSHRWGYLFTAREGKLVRWQAIIDPDSARRELGIESGAAG